MIDKYKEFAEAMRNIMRNNEAEQKKTESEHVDEETDEENYGLKNGCFELYFRDGEIRFRSFIDCEDVMPSTEVIKNSIHCTAAMFKRYAPGIVDIIFSGCTAKEAIAKCEKSPEDELRSMIREVVGEDMDGSDIETMLARLATNLGISDETEETSSENEITEEVVAEPHKESEEEMTVWIILLRCRMRKERMYLSNFLT